MIFEYRCLDDSCKEITTALRSVADRNDPIDCKHCGAETRKIISLSRAHSDLTPYFDDNLDTFIQGKQHRQRVMKDQGVSENHGQNWWTSSIKTRKQI